MKKLSKLISTIFASVSAVGIFCVAVIAKSNVEGLQNNQNQIVEYKQAEAKDGYYYIGIASNWHSGHALSDFYIRWKNGTHSGSDWYIGDYLPSGVSPISGWTILNRGGVEVLRFTMQGGATKFELYTGGDNYPAFTRTLDIESTGGGDLYIVNSARSGITSSYVQRGFWTTFDDCYDDDDPTTKTLFFNPCQDWNRAEWDDEAFCWPKLEVTTKTGTFSQAAVGVCDSNNALRTSNYKNYVFYFNNVPTTDVTAMKVFFNPATASNKNYGEFGSSYVSQWTGGTANIFGTSAKKSWSDGCVTINYSGLYNCEDSKCYLIGKFDNYSDITLTAASSSNLPSINASLQKYDYAESTVYKTTLDVNVGDYFNYYVYTKLSNSDTNPSAYTFNGNALKYNASDYQFKVGNTVLEDISDYIEIDGNNYFNFLTAGRVTFSRSVVGTTSGVLTVNFNPDYSVVTPPYGDASSPSVFIFSSNTFVVAAIGTDTATLYDQNGTQFTFSDGEFVALNSVPVSASGSVLHFNETGYYTIGFYDYGENANGKRVYATTYTRDYSANDANVYAKTLKLLHTCECGNSVTTSSGTSSVASRLATLYNSGMDTRLSQIIIDSDYMFVDYIIGGNDYSGLSKNTTSFTALYKHQYIQCRFNGGSLPTSNAAMPNINDSPIYQEANSIIVIVVASLSALAIVSLGIVNFLIIRKKKRNSVSK